jgi:hypothetical protein
MDDKESESLRDLYAGLVMLGFVMNGSYKEQNINYSTGFAFRIADSMLEARTGKGIVSVKSPIPEGE